MHCIVECSDVQKKSENLLDTLTLFINLLVFTNSTIFENRFSISYQIFMTEKYIRRVIHNQ